MLSGRRNEGVSCTLFSWISEVPPWSLYFIILVFSVVIYKVAFARRLPPLKSLVVYFVLAVGCVLFWIMQLAQFPMIQSLLITVVIIVVTRVRLWYSKKQEK
jgi:hypothetical protein